MLKWLKLAFCAIGVMSGVTAVGHKNRRDAFFKIVTEKSNREGYTSMAAAELPITGPGSNRPVVVLPVLVNSKDPDYEAGPNELISLRNVKYSLAPQYVLLGNQEDRMKSRVRYITVPQSAEDFDDPIIIAEPTLSDNNYPVYGPTSHMRKKFVIKISPRQSVLVSGNVVSSTTPSQGYIPVSEIPTTTPSREYIPVTDNVISTLSQQFLPPFTEKIVPSTLQPNQLSYVVGDVILNTPTPQKEWRQVGNVVAITPPPKNINYIANNVFSIRKDPEQREEDTSDQPKKQSDNTSDRPFTTERSKEQLPNINSEHPKDQLHIPSDRLATPLDFVWNIFNYPFNSPENKTTEQPSKPQITSDPLTPPKEPYNPTTIPWTSDPPEASSSSSKTTNKDPEISITTEMPKTSSSSNFRSKPDSPSTTKRPPSKTSTPTGTYPEEEYIPFAHGLEHMFDTTPEMIKSYQEEKPYDPKLPAVIPSGRKFPERIPSEKDNPFQVTISGPSPAQPRFTRSMRLRIDIKVPSSDYTEAYDLQWHAGSNTARTVVEDGSTIFYRMPLFDGRFQYLKFKVDTWNGTAMGRCTMSPLLPASPRDHEFPGLPDLTPFQFIGFTASEEQPLVERWRHWVIGRPGQDGAAIGESLNYTHDFLLYRDRGRPMPLKYTVVAHSSVLGPYSDSYTHRYRILSAPTSPMLPDRKKICQIVEHMREESSLKPQQRDLTKKAPPRKIPPPDDDLPSDNEDITPYSILEIGNLEAEAINKGDIAANINIGADNGANLASDRGEVVANINIGAGSHVTHRRIVANINIGAGLDTHKDTRGIAILNFGAEGLNDRLEGDAITFGTRGIGTELSSDSRRGLAILNFGTRYSGTRVGLDKQGEDENRNIGKGDSRYGGDLDRKGVNGNKNVGKNGRGADKTAGKRGMDENISIKKAGRNTGDDSDKTGEPGNVNFGKEVPGDVDEDIHFGKGSAGIGEVSDGNVDGNTNSGKDSLGVSGSKKAGASDKGDADKTLNNGTEGISTGEVDKEEILKNKTGVLSETGGVNELLEADSAVKNSFDPMGDFLGLTKPKEYNDLFEQYKKKYMRKYKDDGEEAVRKAQFIKSLRYIDAANRIATNYKLGINYMSDRLKNELRPMFSGVPPEPDNVDLANIPPGASGPVRQYEDDFMTNRSVNAKVGAEDFPSKYSWKEMGFNTKVRDQGANCLSCTLIATTSAVEGLIYVKKGDNKLLSPQSMFDCGEKFSTELKWCAATFPKDAFNFIKSRGLPSDHDYEFMTPMSPSKPEELMCKDDVKSSASITNFYHLRPAADSKDLRLAIKSRSPVVVVFDIVTGGSPQHYNVGILDDIRWCTNPMQRHAVLALGFDFTVPGQEHFIFKNSWGVGWGDKGYANIKSGACNIFKDMSYPVM